MNGSVFEAYSADIEVTRFLTWMRHRSVLQTKTYLAGCVATPVDRSRTYALTSRNDGTLQGAFDLRRTAPHRLEFDMVLACLAWGHGLMSEVRTAIVASASAQPEVWRIGATCDIENGASARVMRNAGCCRKGCCVAGRCIQISAIRRATASPLPASAHRDAARDRTIAGR